MKKFLAIVILFGLCLSVSASAQSTAAQVILGFLSTTCPGSAHTCFIQYDSSNPIPATLKIVP